VNVNGNRGRLAALILGSALSSAGYGAVLPYLYADIATTRGLGGLSAAMTFTAFAVGSLVAAPFAGRLADRHRPALVAALARAGMAVALLALAWASDAPAVWLAAAGVGAGIAMSQPAVAVLLLAWTPEARTRDVFAWQFIALNLALAAGGLVGGLTVDLSTPAGTRPIYWFAAAAALASAIAVHAVGRLDAARPVAGLPVDALDPAGDAGYRALLGQRPVRYLLGIALLLTLACYAQYDSGLPAYALGALHVAPSTIGIGVAVNAVVVSALTRPMVVLTRRFSPTTLLALCGGLWVLCWLIFAVPLALPAAGSLAIVVGYGAISFGETVLAPVLSPFAATLAPDGAVGRTLGAVTGASTAATAVGPAVSGVLLALGVPLLFIAVQLACCVGGAWLALRLGRIVHPRPVLAASPAWTLDVADELVR
jgi:MFS family permease